MIHSAVRSSKSINESGESSFVRHGSLRRVLPKDHNKENIFGRQNEDMNNFYKVVHQEYIILAEYEMVVSENLKGIYAIPSNKNSFVWYGVIFVRNGLYEDGIFRFNITLPENFPDGDHPRVIFQSEVCHPVINSDTNELYLLNGFPIWVKSEQHIWQVLKYIQWIFHNVEASIEHGINRDLLDMYKNNLEAYKEKVRNSVAKSQEHLYDPSDSDDKHFITFERYNPEIHDPVQAEILKQGNEDRPTVLGHSWVTPGTFTPLNRAPSPVSDNDI